jgi:hypothetical protein
MTIIIEDNNEIVSREANIATVVKLVREHHIAGDVTIYHELAASELKGLPDSMVDAIASALSQA